MECVILVRMSNGSVQPITDEDGGVEVFEDEEKAQSLIERHALGALDYQIIELEV